MKRDFCKIGMISGVIAVAMGVIMFIIMLVNNGSTQTFTREGTKFGADFYTYTYDKLEDIFSSTVGTNNNISGLITVAGLGASFLLISSGLFQISFFGCRLNADDERRNARTLTSGQLDSIAEKLDRLNNTLKNAQSSSGPDIGQNSSL